MAGVGGGLQPLEYGKGGQGQVALAVGRGRPSGMSEQIDGQRRRPVGLGPGQVLARYDAARHLGHGGPDPVQVEGVASGDDRLQGLGEVGPADPFPDRRGMPVREERRRRRLGAEPGSVEGPGRRELDRGREPFPGQPDRRRQHFGERQAAEAVGQGVPAVHAARNRDRIRSVEGHGLTAPVAQGCGVGARTGPARGVQAGRGAGVRQVDEGEQVTSHPAGLGGCHTLDRVGGDGAVYRVSSRPHDLQGGQGGKFMRRDRAHAESAGGAHRGEGGHGYQDKRVGRYPAGRKEPD